MKTYAPEYYEDFKCKADKCTHSCCVGWEIDIDEQTLDFYGSVDGPLGEKLKKSIVREGGVHSFSLGEGERCPFLKKNGLCELICELGEEALSDICREHPRFYNYVGEREEVGVGLSCEAAAELILYSEKSPIPRLVSEDSELCSESASDFSPISVRDSILNYLSEGASSLQERILELEEKYGYRSINAAERRELLLSLEIMDPTWRGLISELSEDCNAPEYRDASLLRILSYFIYRHVSSAESKDRAYGAVAFSLFCTRLYGELCATEAARGELTHKRAVELAVLLSSELEYSEENTKAIIDRLTLEVSGES